MLRSFLVICRLAFVLPVARRIGARRVTALVVVGLLAAAATADAQSPVRVRVTRPTLVMEWPRGDSVVTARIPRDTVLELIRESGRWMLVAPPDDLKAPWRRGWIAASDVTFIDRRPVTTATRPPRERMIRGFGQVGGTLFTARDSFEAILESPLGMTFGGGGQLLFANGAFVQGSIDRFQKTGSRVLVSNQQVFRVDVPNTVTVTPILVTAGYREARSDKAIGYLGAGVGWHLLEERSPALLTGDYRKGHVGVHLTGGAEYRFARFVWFAGEVVWASVPDAIGAPGVGSAYDETNLGGAQLKFKVMLGR